jgi:orotate phosphoribosyltransferase-like protein
MISGKDKKVIMEKRTRDLYKLGWSMDEISKMLNISKTTVFFAIRGRSKKKKLKTKN